MTVALPTSYIAAAGSTARLQMSALFAGVTVAVLILGSWIAHHFISPLRRLAQLAGALAEGDLSVRSERPGRDEIGALAATFDVMAESLQRHQLNLVACLTSAIDARDPYTAGHSLRVGQLSSEIGRRMGLSPTALHHLMVGGFLHDIGKIGVRDSVLLKKGRLTPAEHALIQQHPRIGLEILNAADLPDEVREIVGKHHEKLNGEGYPQGLSSGELSVFPRVATVADMYDALTTDRPYRRAVSFEEALHLLRGEAAAMLIDADVVSALTAIAGAWEERRRTDPRLTAFSLPDLTARQSA